MAWSPPTYSGGVVWQDEPSTATALKAANLNQEENAEASFAVAVGQSVVNYVVGSDGKVGGAGTVGLPASVVSTSSLATAVLTPSGGDDSAAMASALTNFAPFVSPIVRLGPGTFQWNAQVPSIARSVKARIVGAGVGQTIVKLTSAAPRFLDPARIGDGDTFSVDIRDLTIDANNVTSNDHVVFGTRVSGSWLHGINFANATVENVTVINAPVGVNGDGTYRIGLAFAPAATGDAGIGNGTTTSASTTLTVNSVTAGSFQNGQLIMGPGITQGTTIVSGGGTGTLIMSAAAGAGFGSGTINAIDPTNAASIDAQCSVTGIHVNNFNMTGGLVGVQFAGIPYQTGCLTSNVWVDDVHVNGGSHICPQPTAFNIGNHVIMGNKGYGGWGTITGFRGYGCSDSGIEVDSMQDFVGTRIVVGDAWNHCFYHAPYHAPGVGSGTTTSDPDSQRHRWVNCFTYRTSTFTGGVAATGFGMSYATKANANYPANVELAGYHYRNEAQLFSTYEAADLNGSPRIAIDGFHAVSNLGTYSGATAQSASMLRVAGLDTSHATFARDSGIKIKVTGNKTGTGTITYTAYTIGQAGTGIYQSESPEIEFALNSICFLMTIGDNGSFPTVSAAINKPVMATSGASSTSGIRVSKTPNTTLNALSIVDADFTRMQASAVEVDFQSDTTQPTKTNVIRARWRNTPAPSTLTVVTATGKSIGTGYPCYLSFVAGSGSGITAIDYSTNGGTTYTNLLTQASGAMPAGANLTVGPVHSASHLIKVTFATTQPTINLIPAI